MSTTYPEFMTVAQTALRLGLSKYQVRAEKARGTLPHHDTPPTLVPPRTAAYTTGPNLARAAAGLPLKEHP